MIREAAAMLERAERIVVLSHYDPDGDALGSSLGLKHLLEATGGKQVTVHSAGPFPEEYAFLPGIDSISQQMPAPDEVDLAVLLDCHQPERAGKVAAEALPKMTRALVIDHHRGGTDFGEVAWVDATYAATSEMITDLAVSRGMALSADAAECLFVGLQTDTGCFRYANTTGRSLRMAAALVDAGADPWAISQQVYVTRPKRVKLLDMVLDSLDYGAGGKLALARVSLDELKSVGARSQDLDQVVEALRTLPGVEVAVLLKELAEGGIKASMRSRGAFDVSRVAISLGGGGHKNAAGMKLEGGLEAAQDRLRDLLGGLMESRA